MSEPRDQNLLVLFKRGLVLATFAIFILATQSLAYMSPEEGWYVCDDKFIPSCDKACEAIGRAPGSQATCVANHITNWRFGCICSDGTDVRNTALDLFEGSLIIEGITRGTFTYLSTSTVHMVTYKFSTPVVKTTARPTATKLTRTLGTTTQYTYRPKSYANGDIVARAPSSSFCENFRQDCALACDKQPVENLCSEDIQATFNEYDLSCKCSQDGTEEATLFLYRESSFISRETRQTSTRTVRSISTISFQTTTTEVTLVTAPTSTSTFLLEATTIKTAGKAVKTALLPSKGRIRVDRRTPGKEKQTLGYWAHERGENFWTPSPEGTFLQLDEKKYAMPVSIELAKDGDKNVYAVQWLRSPHNIWASQWHGGEDMGDPTACGRSFTMWRRHPIPLRPLLNTNHANCSVPSDDDSGECEDPIEWETYTWTLDPMQPNIVNPSRKVQIPLRPFWYSRNGTYVRPAAVFLNDNPPDVIFQDAAVDDANPRCRERYDVSEHIDIVHYFEPDPVDKSKPWFPT